MLVKRRLSREDDDDDETSSPYQHHHQSYRDHQQQQLPPKKRARLADKHTIASRPPDRDIISTLPAELLVRILSYLSEITLLDISPVSCLFHRVTSDHQLWRAHYYRRFILPRAHQIPGFKNNADAGRYAATAYSNLTSSSSGKNIGGVGSSSTGGSDTRGGRVGAKNESAKDHPGNHVDWKKSYKLLHNWARGRCDVEELHFQPQEHGQQRFAAGKTVVKVVEGLAITADSSSGLLVWDLRTRTPIAEAPLEPYRARGVRPTCLAVDEDPINDGAAIGIAAGFEDGTFGVWKLDLARRELTKVCRYDTTSYGGLEAVAYCYPYVLAASKGGVITLWTLDPVNSSWYDPTAEESETEEDDGPTPTAAAAAAAQSHPQRKGRRKQAPLRRPCMLRSLRSHTTKQPLTLSIRRVAASVIASIVYTLDTVNGWCIGIQDLDIRPTLGLPEIVDSRLACTVPIRTRGSASSSQKSSPKRSSPLRPTQVPRLQDSHSDTSPSSDDDDDYDNNDGPMRLCYSHPYLLATLPDNTLVLHLCHSSPNALSISAGIRLWGHTSGISDAEITSRGKAVSVSARGDEIRVWELEGRVGGSSIEVRPRQPYAERDMNPTVMQQQMLDLDYRKNKVEFDDEMVIVLKEGPDGRESLMVYDFA